MGLPLLILGNPLASLIGGYAAAAVITVSLPAGVTWHDRAIAAAIVTLLTLGGMMVAFRPDRGPRAGAAFLATGLADLFAPRGS